jgi:hypothetical protein
MTNTQRVGAWLSNDGALLVPDPSNLYRYVGNSPTNFTDSSGLAKDPPVSAKPQSNDYVFADEYICAKIINRKSKTIATAINRLIELRDEAKKPESLITLNVYYVVNPMSVAEFAEHTVSKAGVKSISYYLGHGAGADTVDKDTLARVTKAFGGLKNDDMRLFGMNSCFPGPYNGTIPKMNQIMGMGNDEGEIKDILFFQRFANEVGTIYNAAMASVQKKEKVEINLYFGEELKRVEDKDKYPLLKDGGAKYHFANWEKIPIN